MASVPPGKKLKPRQLGTPTPRDGLRKEGEEIIILSPPRGGAVNIKQV